MSEAPIGRYDFWVCARTQDIPEGGEKVAGVAGNDAEETLAWIDVVGVLTRGNLTEGAGEGEGDSYAGDRLVGKGS
jgi:hypothetical protein